MFGSYHLYIRVDIDTTLARSNMVMRHLETVFKRLY